MENGAGRAVSAGFHHVRLALRDRALGDGLGRTPQRRQAKPPHLNLPHQGNRLGDLLIRIAAL